MTKEERQKKIENNPRLKRFVDSGDADNAARLTSMAYLLFSIAQQYTEEAMDILKKHGFLHRELKHFGNNLIRSFDMYDRQLSSMIEDSEARDQLMTDYDIFEEVCRKYMNTKEL